MNESAKTGVLLNLDDYTVDFQVIQSSDQNWLYCLHLFPSNVIEISDNKNLEKVHLYSRELYNQWEYAAESAVDIIEILGFNVSNDIHHFDVLFWNTNENDRVTKKAFTDGLEFKLETESK